MGVEPKSQKALPICKSNVNAATHNPTQVPTCNPNHIKQKTRIENNKSKSTSACYRVQLQSLNSKLQILQHSH